ncbi:MAG: tRNA (adenosine(37)-N6)-threonylcarbamoyltransferase complex dimerization subunit type 1 TsaB [Buchnera aphidicola (Floraphis choui)]
MNKTILAFDSSFSNCSVSLLYKNNVYSKKKICSKNQTKYILPMIKKILEVNTIKLHEIDIITISKGPGNFIGIRTTIAIAQGIALGLNIPIVSFPAALIMAEQAWKIFDKKKILVIFKIDDSRIYLMQYIKNQQQYWTKKKSKTILTLKEVINKLYILRTPWVIVGNCLELFSKNIYKNLIFTNITTPQSEFIISLYLSHKCYRRCNFSKKIFPIYFQKEVY